MGFESPKRLNDSKELLFKFEKAKLGKIIDNCIKRIAQGSLFHYILAKVHFEFNNFLGRKGSPFPKLQITE